ncbi:MAG: flippase-like domain-containing protein [Christensenellaceae bacterium]|nr:flippase-like domain-containing protein [Christensenellaceae bacterium]
MRGDTSNKKISVAQATKESIDVAVKRTSKRKKIFILLFVILNIITIGVTALIEFTGSDSGAADNLNFTGLKLHFLIVAFLVFCAVLLAETIKYAVMLKATTNKFHPGMAFQVAALGKYYDNVTPLGSGGQPFQVHYLNKRNVSFGVASSLPIAGFLMNQFAFMMLMIIGIIINTSRSFVTSPVLLASAYIGMVFYVIVPVMVVLFTVMPKVSGSILRFFIRIGHKLRLVKHPDETTVKVLHNMEAYRQSLAALSKTKGLLIMVFIFSMAYQICMCSIPYFVLKAFGAGNAFIDIFFMCVYTYAAVTYIPTPGNAGAAEGTFYALFKTLKSGNIFWAMLIWRFLSYYMFLVTGVGIYVYNFVKNKRTLRNKKEEQNEGDAGNA